MFGSEILDIIIGLIFVYFLLSLVCSAINEYIASITNKRGKVLVQGIEALLKDSGVTDAFYEHPLVATLIGEKDLLDRYMAREKNLTTNWWPGFRWVYRLYSWFRHHDLRHYRIPSYLPARTFALALLDAAGYNHPANRRAGDPVTSRSIAPPSTGAAADADTPASGGAEKTTAVPGAAPGGTQLATPPMPANPSASADPGSGGDPPASGLRPSFRKVLDTLQRDSAVDVAEFSTLEMAARLADENLPAAVRDRVGGLLAQGGFEIQKLHDSVEVWFNNGMDRVSGSYKRHTQTMLFAIGVVVSIAVNADTLDLWRRLSTDKSLRDGLANQAVQSYESIRAAQVLAAANTAPADTPAANAGAVADSTDATRPAMTDTTAPAGDTTRRGTRAGVLASAIQRSSSPDQAHARMVLDSAIAELDQTQLRLGWTARDAERLGVLVPSAALPVAGQRVAATRPQWRVEWRPWNWYRTTFWPKLIGLLVTAFALSLGAPFWFDMLNKVVNIRSAGRAPDERAKKPEGQGKRAAELPTR
jgi:hypothetical protein